MAQTLLMLALTLLIQAQAPGVPDSLKATAIDTANRAIVAAQAEIALQSAIIPDMKKPVSVGAAESPKPVEAVVLKPTTIKVEQLPGRALYGGNCGRVLFKVTVLDQFGNNMSGQKVTSDVAVLVNNGDFNFKYSSPNFKTKDTITFSVGDLKQTYDVQVLGSMLEERGMDSFIQVREDFWQEKNSGSNYYPKTNTCKTPIY